MKLKQLNFYLIISILICNYCKTNEIYHIASGKIAEIKMTVRLDSIEATKLFETESTFDNKKILDYENLKAMTKNFSVDYSTVYLLKTIYQDRKNLEIQKKYVELSEKLIKNPDSMKVEIESLKKYSFVFVPGLAYKIDTTTGADFFRQRTWFQKKGISTELIETDELGLTIPNAKLIENYIRQYKKQNKIVLVSASKGGLDVIYYLEKLATKEDLKKIHSWVNVGGILRGTLIADQHCDFPLSIVPAALLGLKGRTLELVGDIRRSSKVNFFNNLEFEKQIKIIHLVAIPFRSQVRKEVLSRYLTLAEHGPNDGLTLISDTIFPKGRIISEIGLDHFFKDENIDLKTAAIAILLTR